MGSDPSASFPASTLGAGQADHGVAGQLGHEAEAEAGQLPLPADLDAAGLSEWFRDFAPLTDAAVKAPKDWWQTESQNPSSPDSDDHGPLPGTSSNSTESEAGESDGGGDPSQNDPAPGAHMVYCGGDPANWSEDLQTLVDQTFKAKHVTPCMLILGAALKNSESVKELQRHRDFAQQEIDQCYREASDVSVSMREELLAKYVDMNIFKHIPDEKPKEDLLGKRWDHLNDMNKAFQSKCKYIEALRPSVSVIDYYVSGFLDGTAKKYWQEEDARMVKRDGFSENEGFFKDANNAIEENCSLRRYKNSRGELLLPMPTVLRVVPTNSYCIFFIANRLLVFLLKQTVRLNVIARTALSKEGIRCLVSSYGPEYHFSLSKVRFSKGYSTKTQGTLLECSRVYSGAAKSSDWRLLHESYDATSARGTMDVSSHHPDKDHGKSVPCFG